MALDERYVEERMPVWRALSNFYLDTELSELTFDHMVLVCAKSPYSTKELEQIMFGEVWPALGRNLSAFTGEWMGWNDDYIRESILRSYNMRWRLPWLLNPFKRVLKTEWERLIDLVSRQRGSESVRKDDNSGVALSTKSGSTGNGQNLR